MSGKQGGLLVLLVVDIVLTAARVFEILNGHTPTPELTAAFTAAVTATITYAGVAFHMNGVGK